MNDLKTITSTLVWDDKTYLLNYQDKNDFSDLPYDLCKQVYGVCFYNNDIVITKSSGVKTGNGWGLVGGHIEKGETFEETLIREVQEETNMQVLKYIPIGVQIVTYPDGITKDYQLRYYAKVKPFGPFVNDPAGSVKEIKLINPKEYKDYFDWGKIGERIITRAINFNSF